MEAVVQAGAGAGPPRPDTCVSRPARCAPPSVRWTCCKRHLSPQLADRRADAIPHWMARLLRFLPDPTCAHEPGSVDSPKITLVSLAVVAERAQPLQRTAPSWRTEVQRSGRRRFANGVLAHVRTPGGPTGPAQPLLRLTRSPPNLCL